MEWEQSFRFSPACHDPLQCRTNVLPPPPMHCIISSTILFPLQQAEADAARAEGIVVIAVGVGPGPTAATLLAIGGDESNVFDIDEFSELDGEFTVFEYHYCSSVIFAPDGHRPGAFHIGPEGLKSPSNHRPDLSAGTQQDNTHSARVSVMMLVRYPHVRSHVD